MNELSLYKIDKILKRYNESQTFKLKTFGVFYAQRVDNRIYLKSISHKAEGKISGEGDNIRITFKYEMRTLVKLCLLIPIVLLQSVFLLPKVTINGHINPSFNDKLIFVLLGLILVGIVYIIFQSGRKTIIDEVETGFLL